MELLLENYACLCAERWWYRWQSRFPKSKSSISHQFGEFSNNLSWVNVLQSRKKRRELNDRNISRVTSLCVVDIGDEIFYKVWVCYASFKGDLSRKNHCRVEFKYYHLLEISWRWRVYSLVEICNFMWWNLTANILQYFSIL